MTSREQQLERSKQLDKALEARARAQINVYEHRDKLSRVRQQHESLRAQAMATNDPVKRSVRSSALVGDKQHKSQRNNGRCGRRVSSGHVLNHPQ